MRTRSSLVEVVDCVSLISNEIIETVVVVCVNEAIADPLGRLDAVPYNSHIG